MAPAQIPPTQTGIMQILPAAADAHGAALAATSSAAAASGAAVQPPLLLDDWWKAVAAQLAGLQPNRQMFLDVAVAPKSAAAAAAAPAAASAGGPKKTAAASSSSSASAAASKQLAIPSPAPRYSLWILDADLSGTAAAASRAVRATVLVLPQGRESEWQFRSVSGGSEIARANGLARVIFVALNRGQEFKSLAAVQAELQPFLRLLSPQALTEKMSITSLGSDVGQRRSVAREASSSVAGGFVEIEDVLVGQHVHRRMVFSGAGGGGGLVQSEARLNVAPAFLSMTAAQRKALKAKQKKKDKKKSAKTATTAAAGAAAAEDEGKDDDGGADDAGDDAEAAESAAPNSAASPAASSSSSASNSLICFNYLPCEYQHGLLALLALFGASSAAAPAAAASSSSAASASPAPTPAVLPSCMLLVGLGGGSLAMFLSLSLPRMQLDVVELDNKVVETARTYFGYKEPAATTAATRDRVRTHVADGLEVVAKLASGAAQSATAAAVSSSASASAAFSSPVTRPDVILLDVNSPDLGEGLSFPPAAFLAPAFLDQVAQILSAPPLDAADDPSAAAATARADGWLLLNLGCRNEPLRDSLFAALSSRFRSVLAIKPDAAHVNFVVAATNRQLRANADAAASTSIEWDATAQRLRALQSAASGAAVAGASPFSWSAEMSEEVESMLKRLQWVDAAASSTTAPATVRMQAVFPKQQAEEEEKDK